MSLRISVITPCHNAERWISQALNSIAKQTYSAHEIIVIDDASSDNSIAEIGRSGVPVEIIRVNVRNAAAARNAGIRRATGDWLAFLDADDIWYPNHLARAVKLISQSNDVAYISNHDWIGLNGETLAIPDEFQCKITEPHSRMDVEQFFKLTESGFHFGHSTVLYRLDEVRRVGMFDPTQTRRHDSDLWIRMIADRTWTYDSVKTAGYRENTPGSLSKSETECDYFYLRALVKNSDLVSCPSFRRHLAREARRAMGIAFVNGPSSNFQRINGLAWQHLSPTYKCLYRLMSLCPRAAQEVIRQKRRYVLKKSRQKD